MDSDEKIFVQTCTNLQFRRLLLLCFWRDGRRACVAELYSSYRTHQELCKIQQRTVPWTNPFASFLRSAHAAYQNIPWQPEISTDPSILSSFMRVSEERRFVFDMVDRVEAVAVTFDRLRELCKMYLRSQKTIDVVVEKQRSANPSRNVFEVPEKEMKKCDRCRWESYGLALFACYEMSTFVGLGKVSPRVDSHLEYLVGVRNKILVHPRRDGFVKNSSSGLTLGPILLPHIVGADSWMPLLRNQYLNALRDANEFLDDVASMAANVRLIRSKTMVKDFTPLNRLLLKAYVVPEPDLLGSAAELATQLETSLLPEIREACRPA